MMKKTVSDFSEQIFNNKTCHFLIWDMSSGVPVAINDMAVFQVKSVKRLICKKAFLVNCFAKSTWLKQKIKF